MNAKKTPPVKKPVSSKAAAKPPAAKPRPGLLERAALPDANIFQRLLAIAGDVDGRVDKTKNTEQNYEFLGIDAVLGATRQAFVKYGVHFGYLITEMRVREEMRATRYDQKLVTICEVDILVRFTNTDEPSEFAEYNSKGMAIDYQDKASAKSISYAIKTLFLQIFFLKGNPDNEADSITEPQRHGRSAPPQGRNQPPPKPKPKTYGVTRFNQDRETIQAKLNEGKPIAQLISAIEEKAGYKLTDKAREQILAMKPASEMMREPGADEHEPLPDELPPMPADTDAIEIPAPPPPTPTGEGEAGDPQSDLPF